MVSHLGVGSFGESLPPAGLLEVPLDLRPEPQVCEFGGFKSGGFYAAETLLTNPRLFRVRNGPGAASSESGQMKRVVWCRRGGRRQWNLGGREGGNSREEEGYREPQVRGHGSGVRRSDRARSVRDLFRGCISSPLALLTGPVSTRVWK